MRLLRLTSRTNNATFDAFFNSDIILKPNSKIALQSVSINNLNKIIQLTTDNNEIQYGINGSYSKVIQLTPRVYESSQVLELLEDIGNKLNQSSSFSFGDSQKVLGIEWDATINDNNVVSIQYALGNPSNYATEWEFQGTEFSPANSNNAYLSANSDTSVSDFSQNCLLEYSLARGNSYFRTKTFRLEGGNTKNGYLMGVYEDGDTTNANLNMSKIKYGIRVDVDGGGNRIYRTIIEGVEDTATTAMLTYASDNRSENETQEIAINGGQIEINIYRKGATSPTILASIPITNNEKINLKGVCAFFGTKTTTRTTLVRFIPSPYGDQPTPTSDTDDDLTAPPRPSRNRNNTDPNFFEFQSLRLSEYLGYENQRIPNFGTVAGLEIDYFADHEFAIPQEADAMLVQLLSLNLESYDTYADVSESGGQRSNLLAVIPQTNDSGKIVYEPNFITFLELDNKENINLRNVSLRIVREDYEQIKTVGLNTVVLLIQ